ncbi:MAG: hypothetical protein R6V51_05545 [Dehalococcoidia bacterium]
MDDSKRPGIEAEVRSIDFDFIMERVTRPVSTIGQHMKRGIDETENLDY